MKAFWVGIILLGIALWVPHVEGEDPPVKEPELTGRVGQFFFTDQPYFMAGMDIRHPYGLWVNQPENDSYFVFGVLRKNSILRLVEVRRAQKTVGPRKSYYVAQVENGIFRGWRVEFFEGDLKRFILEKKRADMGIKDPEDETNRWKRYLPKDPKESEKKPGE